MSKAGGFFYLLTVTSPGDRAHCKAPKCRGQGDGLGCKHSRCRCTPVGGIDLAEWNASHSSRWNHLRTRLRQEHEGLEYFRGVEVQDGKRGGTSRGALHDHVMVWSPTELDVKSVRAMAMDAGFGHSLVLDPVEAGSGKAAHYVSKYVTKASDSRAEVPWQVVDPETGEVTTASGRFRTWSQSYGWGETMTAIRERARDYAALKQEDREDDALMAALGYLRNEDLFGHVEGVTWDGAPPGT